MKNGSLGPGLSGKGIITPVNAGASAVIRVETPQQPPPCARKPAPPLMRESRSFQILYSRASENNGLMARGMCQRTINNSNSNTVCGIAPSALCRFFLNFGGANNVLPPIPHTGMTSSRLVETHEAREP